jgi:hypothetical protein
MCTDATGWIALVENSDRYLGYPLVCWEVAQDEDGEFVSTKGLAIESKDQMTLFAPIDLEGFVAYVPPNSDPYAWIGNEKVFQLPIQRGTISLVNPLSVINY